MIFPYRKPRPIGLGFSNEKKSSNTQTSSVDNNLLTLVNGLTSFLVCSNLHKSGHTEYLFVLTIYYMKIIVNWSQDGALCISMARNPG